MDVLVSIIVPIFNMESTLKKSVGSLQKQTYKNIEIILINDGSTDLSSEIADKLAAEDERITVIHKENEGVSIARNIGINTAKGDYISFVDPDDWTSPLLISTLLEKALSETSDVTVSCAMVVNRQTNEEIKNSFFDESDNNVDKIRAISQLLTNDHFKDSDSYIDIGVPWGKLYKSSFLKENKIKFKQELRRNQDNIFNLYAFHYSNQIAYIDEPLYFYDYEHFESLHIKVTLDADILYSNLAKETYEFATSYYNSNNLIMNLAYNKVIKYLAEILNKKLLNPNHNVKFYERSKEIDNIINSYPFSIVLKFNSFSFVSRNVKWLFCLIKLKAYRTIYLLLKIRIKILTR